MTTAVIDAPAAARAGESPSSHLDFAQIAEEICNNAVRLQLWDDRKLTTYEFRYDARRSDSKELLADKYRSEIVNYLPHFWKTHGVIRANDFSSKSSMPRFIKECATCYSYLIALKRRNSTALSFDNERDKVWAKRMELEAIEERIEELQDELGELEKEERWLTRYLEAAEEDEKKKGNQS